MSYTQSDAKQAHYRSKMRQDLSEILIVVKADYIVLDDLVWGRSDRKITSLLKDPISDEGEDGASVVIDLTGDASRCDVSNQQLKRLRRQAHAMLFWMSLRVRQLERMVTHFQSNQKDGMRDFYHKFPDGTRASLVAQVCKRAGICSKTWRKWLKEYLTNNGKFNRDTRGLAQFGWLLVNEDKKLEFSNWLKNQKEVSVQMALDFVNKTLLKEFPFGRPTNWGRLVRPTFPSTVHKWMLQCGCTYDEVTKNFLTDSHERHSTLLYRTWAADLDHFLSLRMHRWVCFPKSVVAKLKSKHKDWPDDDVGLEISFADVGKFPPGNVFFLSMQRPSCVFQAPFNCSHRCWHGGLCSTGQHRKLDRVSRGFYA